MNLRRPFALTATLALTGWTALLAGCGGGGGDANIGGSVSGLASGATLTLQDNSSDTLTVSANGSFTFAQTVAPNGSYTVTVLAQPSGQACSVAGGSGTVDGNGDAINTVTVSCVTLATLGGTVSGLLSGTAVTLTDGTVLLPVATNGSFAFPGLLAVGTSYSVTVATQPAGQTCTVLGGSGTVASGSVPAITVSCS